MEVCFVDVGQGAASIVLLGGKRAIVIDCGGKRARTVQSALKHFRVDTITRLVVTHSHDDHSGGAAAILTDYPHRVEQIWMLQDTTLAGSLFGRRVQEELAAGRLADGQIRRLERDDKVREVYRGDGVLLSVVAPTFAANWRAEVSRKPNDTSGVLILKGHGEQIVYCSDSTIPEWERIRRQRGRPIKCMLLTIPHHGGVVWGKRQPGETDPVSDARVRSELDWFYAEALNAKIGVMSVGTSNTYGHPRPEVVDALRRSGGTVFCTQMTRQCDGDLEAQRRRSLPMILPSQSSSLPLHTASGKSKNVACGGTLSVVFLPGSQSLTRLQEHADSVNRVPQIAGAGPLCRRPL